MNISTILPVSRIQYLDTVLNSLKEQTLKPNSLLVIFDGPEGQFAEVCNKTKEIGLANVVCLQSTNIRPAFSIPERRTHIVNIHNQIRDVLDDCDWVFSIEDDGILPSDALERLVNVAKTNTDAGMITGVELGRWGVPYVGAWTVDDVHSPRIITSLENKTLQSPPTVEEIDACGLYCALIRTDLYKQHEFYTANGLGPDVNLALFLRQQGLKNYIDWGVPVTHMTNSMGEEITIPATSRSRVVAMRLLSGSTWQASSLT